MAHGRKERREHMRELGRALERQFGWRLYGYDPDLAFDVSGDLPYGSLSQTLSVDVAEQIVLALRPHEKEKQ